MVKLVDTLALGASPSNRVQVRILFWAPGRQSHCVGSMEVSMSETVKHLDREWDVMGWPKETLYSNGRIAIGERMEEMLDEDARDDDIQAHVYQNLKQLLDTFSSQDHSDFSASYIINLFKKLASFQSISPLTGNESEWTDLGEGRKQNKRCHHVFMSADGSAYDINGKIFRDQDGITYTSKDSRVPVEFPYTPKSEIVDYRLIE